MTFFLFQLVSAFCVWINPTQSQFFYSHYTPFAPQFSQFYPQTFLPPTPVVAPLAYSVSSSQVSSSPAAVTYNIPPRTAEYRGFGYRTDLKDGAASTVFYVTGPEATNLLNFRDFPNFTRKVQDDQGKARSLASDLIDVNAIPDAQGKIQSVLQPTEFQKLFENVMPGGLINFYTFPAGTVPLARQFQFGNVTLNVTTTTPSSSSEEAVAAESVVNPKVVINDVDNIIKSNETTGTTTVAAETGSSESQENTPTTENSDAASDKTKDEKSTTASNEEATTVEATTQV
jgi:hypothetical protein